MEYTVINTSVIVTCILNYLPTLDIMSRSVLHTESDVDKHFSFAIGATL
jgi:hypothetical protein